ncbi:MAG: hypothetical protein K5854_07860 [Prevotella sp.]|nr:hypothetical protein [Prevotella sp.]
METKITLEEEVARRSFSKSSNSSHTTLNSMLDKALAGKDLPEVVVPVVNNMKLAHDVEAKTWRVNTTFQQTTDTDKCDADWRAYLYMIKSRAKGMRRHVDSTLAKEADDIWNYLCKRAVVLSKGKKKGLGQCLKIVGDLTTIYPKAVEDLGMGDDLEKMKAIADREADLFLERATERSEAEVGKDAMKIARANSDNCFKKIVKILDGLAELETEDGKKARAVIGVLNACIVEWELHSDVKSHAAKTDENADTTQEQKGNSKGKNKNKKDKEKTDLEPEKQKDGGESALKPSGKEGEQPASDPSQKEGEKQQPSDNPSPKEGEQPNGKEEAPSGGEDANPLKPAL